MKAGLVGLCALGASLLYVTPSNGSVLEISAPWLNDIASAQFTADGPVIYVNPKLCAAAGERACRFSLLHEYGHVILGHQKFFYRASASGRKLAEVEADCYAARQASFLEVRAAVEFFSGPELVNHDDGVHGTGMDRIGRIKRCRSM